MQTKLCTNASNPYTIEKNNIQIKQRNNSKLYSTEICTVHAFKVPNRISNKKWKDEFSVIKILFVYLFSKINGDGAIFILGTLKIESYLNSKENSIIKCFA